MWRAPDTTACGSSEAVAAAHEGQGGGLTATISVAVGSAAPHALELTSAYSWYYGAYPFSNKPSQGKAQVQTKNGQKRQGQS